MHDQLMLMIVFPSPLLQRIIQPEHPSPHLPLHRLLTPQTLKPHTGQLPTHKCQNYRKSSHIILFKKRSTLFVEVYFSVDSQGGMLLVDKGEGVGAGGAMLACLGGEEEEEFLGGEEERG